MDINLELDQEIEIQGIKQTVTVLITAEVSFDGYQYTTDDVYIDKILLQNKKMMHLEDLSDDQIEEILDKAHVELEPKLVALDNGSELELTKKVLH